MKMIEFKTTDGYTVAVNASTVTHVMDTAEGIGCRIFFQSGLEVHLEAGMDDVVFKLLGRSGEFSYDK